jgi:hypothetical protein
MKIKLLFVVLFLASGFTLAQEYPLVTIQDIQYLPDSIISIGDAPSPLLGDTVRFRGVVMVTPVVDPINDRRPVVWRGARWSTFAVDPNNEPWGGVVVIQHDTSSPGVQNTFFDLVDTAQVVEFTAIVEEYFTTTQVAMLLNPVTPIQIIEQLPKRPDPIELSMTDLMKDGKVVLESEKYEGMYVILRNLISSERNSATGAFRLNDPSGNYVVMYDQSGYFSHRSDRRLTGLTEYSAPIDGTVINYIKGFLESRTDAYYIIPVYPGDIDISLTPPSISSITRNIDLIQPNQPVEISARIIDLDGEVAEAKLFYKVDDGASTALNMTRSASDTTIYTATIPGVSSDSAVVSYYIWAKDNIDLSSINPTDTVRNRYFYLVLNRPVTIQDVQYSPYGSGFSGYNNRRVELTGVVTADSSDLPGWGSTPLRIYMQNGTGPWSGIQIGTRGALGTQVLNLRSGDNVTVNGVIIEDFAVTRIDSLTQIIVNSSSNPLPEAEVLITGTIAKLPGGEVPAEQWESVLIEYQNLTVTNQSADGASNFGEMFVDDGSGETRVELQDGNHIYHNLWDPALANDPSLIQVTTGSKFEKMKGILFFSFSNWKLVPRTNDDFEGFAVDVKKEKPAAPVKYALDQNYPNPFNPATSISYSIPKDGNVTLKIFNIIGQEVKTLINKYQSAGEYKITFDASDLNSGVYFYSITSGEYNQVKKMMLIK